MILAGSVFNICLSPFLWSGITFGFFHLLGIFPLSKWHSKISFKGLLIESSQIFTIAMLILSWPWALFGSRLLIIFRISLFEKSIVVSDSCNFFFFFFFFEREREIVAGSSILFLSIEHWSSKKLLIILALSLAFYPMINLS